MSKTHLHNRDSEQRPHLLYKSTHSIHACKLSYGGGDKLPTGGQGWTTYSGDPAACSPGRQVAKGWGTTVALGQVRQTIRSINLMWLLLPSRYLHAVSITPRQDMKLQKRAIESYKPHKPSIFGSPCVLFDLGWWQMFIIAPLIPLCLGEGDIFLNICTTLTATCTAADRSLALWQDISRSFSRSRGQIRQICQEKKQKNNNIQPLLTASGDSRVVNNISGSWECAMCDVWFLRDMMEFVWDFESTSSLGDWSFLRKLFTGNCLFEEDLSG